MDRRQTAYDLLCRAKYDGNSFLHNEFIYPCMIKGLDSFTDKELEDLMLRSEYRTNEYEIVVPTLTNLTVTVATNKSIEEVKSDLISCNNDLHKLFSKFDMVDYTPLSEITYSRCVGQPEVTITDINDDENEIVYDY